MIESTTTKICVLIKLNGKRTSGEEFSMNIIYFILTIISIYFIVTAIVHSRHTHLIANKMERQFEHYFNEDALQNDQHIVSK